MVKRLTILFFADDSCPSIPDAINDLKGVCEDKLADIDYSIKLIYLGWAGTVNAPDGVPVDSDARRYGLSTARAVYKQGGTEPGRKESARKSIMHSGPAGDRLPLQTPLSQAYVQWILARVQGSWRAALLPHEK